MATSSHNDSLYLSLLSNNIKVSIEHNMISTTADTLEVCAESADISFHNSPNSFTTPSAPIIFKKYLNNDSIIPTHEKDRTLISACFGVVPEFDLVKAS